VWIKTSVCHQIPYPAFSGIFVNLYDYGDSFEPINKPSQVDGLARGKYIADETGLPAAFKYHRSGSMWMLDEYLNEHPDIRKRVHQRLSRVPETSEDGLLDRVRSLLGR